MMTTIQIDVPAEIGSKVHVVDSMFKEVSKVCRFCDGHGDIKGLDRSSATCPKCRGKGTVGSSVKVFYDLSEDCDGKGLFIRGYKIENNHSGEAVVYANVIDEDENEMFEDCGAELDMVFVDREEMLAEIEKRNAEV